MRKHVFMAMLAALFLMALVIPVYALEAGNDAPAFDLTDQFDKKWELTALKGSVVVLIAATPKSGEAMDPWIASLGKKYGAKIGLVGMMDLHGLPGVIRSIAKSRIKKETKQPLMLDFSGAVSRAYGANDKYPVVVVIDKNSDIALIANSYTEESFSSVAARIDALL